MADKTVILEVQLLEGNAQSKLDALRASVQGLDKTHKDYAPTLKLIAQAERDLSKVQQKRILIEKGLISSTTNVDKATKNTGKQMKQLGSDTGGATAAAMELGRVVSDAPYGIRGMANNVSQLASQLFYMAGQQKVATTATTTDTVAKGVNTTATVVATGATVGFAGAVRMMWSALMGPMGFLLGLQAIIASLDYFYGGMKKAETAVNDLTNQTYASSLVAKQYVKELENVNINEERRKVVTKELIKLVPTLTAEDLKYGKNLDKVRLKINSYALAQASRIEIDKLVQDNSEILALKNQTNQIKAIDSQKDRIEKMVKFISEQGKDVSGFYVGFGVEELIEEGDVNQIEETFKRLGEVIDRQSKPIMDRILELTSSLELDPDKNKKGKNRDKVFELGLDSVDIGAEAKKGKKMLKAVADAMGIDMKKDPLEIDTNLDLTLSPEAKKAAADALKAQVDEMVRQSELEDLASFNADHFVFHPPATILDQVMSLPNICLNTGASVK